MIFSLSVSRTIAISFADAFSFCVRSPLPAKMSLLAGVPIIIDTRLTPSIVLILFVNNISTTESWYALSLIIVCNMSFPFLTLQIYFYGHNDCNEYLR